MICDVCGRNNADTLTFCQDCGRRLRVQRVVAPTPPSGIAKIEIPASAQIPSSAGQRSAAPSSRDEGRVTPPPPSGPSSPRRSRPEVPSFSFKPASEPPVAVSSGPLSPAQLGAINNGMARSSRRSDPGQAPSAGTVLCSSCQTANPSDYRFCVTCGAILKRAESPSAERAVEARLAEAPTQPAASIVAQARAQVAPDPPRERPADPPIHAAHARPEPRGDDKIVGAPVVDIASAGQAPARFVICTRCHGSCVAGTRFCKYCGAPLDEGRVAITPDPEDPSPPDTRPTERRSQEAARRREATPPPEPLLSAELLSPGGGHLDHGAPARNAPTAPTGSSGKAPASPGRAGGHAHREDLLEAYPSINELAEPGRRPEISQLAGSPIPAMPMPIPASRGPFTQGGPSASTSAPAYGAQAAPSPGYGSGARKLDRRGTGRLVVIVEDGTEGRSFSLGEGQLDIGRVDGDIILEDDHYVSPRHARLRLVDGRWVLRDLDSTNHVYVRLRRPHPLRDGDLLLLGLEVLQFQTVSDGERGLGHAMQHGTLLFGSPATPRRARLCQRTVEGVIRDVYHLFRDETVIGREMGDIVFTADPFLSRRHASIRRSATTGEFAVVDLDSSNGTYAAIRGEVGLSNGDYLRIGQHLFRVDLG